MPSFLRKYFYAVLFFATVFGIFLLPFGNAYAFDGSVNMSEFVIPTSGSGYTISTGESIRYSTEPGDVSGTVRMYKNTNWEQFVNDGSKIRRREDTSWAPNGDVHCANGNRAIYTLTTESVPGLGQQVNGSAGWLSNSINFSASKASANSDTLNIVPLDSVPVYDSNGAQRPYCTLSDLPGYPAIGASQQMKLTYYDSNSFTFCTKIKNPNPLIKIEVTGGFGSEDTFLYMKNYGLVGFSDPTGRDAGWMGPGADPSDCSAGGGGGKPVRYLNGQVLSSRLLQGYGVSGSKKGAGLSKTISSGLPVEGAVIASYQGTFNAENQTGKQRGEIKSLFSSVATNSDGRFSLPMRVWEFEDSNYIAFFCGNKIKDLYKMDATKDINGFSVTVDCDRKESPAKPPSDLQYANRDNWLSCNLSDTTGARGKTNEPEVAPRTTLKREGLDDTYLGKRYTGPDPGPDNIPPEANPQSRRQLDGTASPSQITFSPDVLRDAKYTLVGSCYGTLEPPRQGDTEPPKLIDCKYLKECNSPLADSEKGTGRNSQMNSSLSLAFSTPGTYAKRYDVVDKDLAVCNDGSGDVKLGEICPPWKTESECAPFKLGREYFPYDALYSNKNQTIDVDLEMYTINDSGKNVSDAGLELWRDQSLITGAGKADKPYKNRVKSVFPTDRTREWSLPNITCMLSNTCFSYDTKSGGLDSPVCTFNTPGTICGFDKNKGNEAGLDPDIALKKIGRGIYRMGLMESLCTCSSMDPTCKGDQPKMNTFTGQTDFWAAGGYTYATDASQGFLGSPPPETYYGNKVTGGGFFAGLINLITKFFVWIGNYNTSAKGQCIPKDWEPIGTWCDFEANPDGCKAECKVVEDGSGCAPSDYCMDVTCTGGTCISNIEPDIPRECTFYTGVDGPYTCSGDVKYPYEGTMQAVSMPGGELASLKEISLLLKSPFDPGSESEVPPLCNFDAAVSDAEFPDDQPLVGHDSPCVDGPSYYSDKLRSVNRVYIPENNPLNDPDYGGGAGGGDCDKGAKINGLHNVKPFGALKTAIQATTYAAQVDYDRLEICYNDVVETARSTGNDPAFIMSLWIEESGAGFYKDAAEFGCANRPKDFKSQLSCVTGLQENYTSGSLFQTCRDSRPPEGSLDVRKFLQIFSGGNSACVDNNFGTNPNFEQQITDFYSVSVDNGKSLTQSCVLPNNRWDDTCSTMAANYCTKPGPYDKDYSPMVSKYTNLNPDLAGNKKDVYVVSEASKPLSDFIKYVTNTFGRKLVAAYGLRNYDQQLALCQECQANKAVDPNYPCMVAPAEWSNHRTGKAVDLFIVEGGSLIKVTDEIITKGFSFGFRHPISSDPPHFEYGK